MAATTFCKPLLEKPPVLRAANVEPHWYAVYTCANHEKRVAARLSHAAIEQYLPLYQTVRRWKDRRMQIETPLFPGYVFVRLALPDCLQVLRTPGVVHLVGCNGLPTPLPNEEIETLRKGLAHGRTAQPHPYLTAGRRVRVTGGPLAGLEGILLRRKSNFRVVVSLELILRAIAVDVDSADVRPIAQRAAAE